MKAVFFTHKISNKEKLFYTEFYRQDIDILESLGFEVIIATRWSEIPYNCDLYYIWWWTWAFIPLLKAKISRKPAIITGVFNLYSPEPSQCYFTRPLRQKVLMSSALRFSDANVFVSQLEFEGVSRLLPVTNPSYIPHVVDENKYSFCGGERENLVLTFCLMARGNSKRKKIREIILSVPAVIEKHPELRFIIAGSKEDDFPELDSLVKEMHLEKSVSFPGVLSVQDKIDLMHRAVIYLQPSEQEGFGLAIAEAMSCGTPVIVNPVGAVPEVVGNAGIYLDGYEPTEIANKISILIEDPDLWEKKSLEGRQRINSAFPFQRRRDQLQELIMSFI